MRTTLSLDPDVAQEVERLRRQSGRSLKEVVNALMRAGINRTQRDDARAQDKRWTTPVNCGRVLVPLDELADTGALLAQLDADGFEGS